MILLALGSNLSSAEFGEPREILEAALDVLPTYETFVSHRSSWYRSAPVPVSDQPWFVNGVACIETEASASDLLAILHEIEARFGRERSTRNESRILDLDLIAYGMECYSEPGGLVLPHPRIAERAFVLIPLLEIAPRWRHPVTGQTPSEMLGNLSGVQQIERFR